MVEVIACRDSGWVDFNTDYQQWNHTCRAFNAKLQMAECLKLACLPPGVPVVVLEEQGDTLLRDFVHPEDCVYVFGRSCLNGIQNMVKHDHVVRIATPKEICLFGVSAVSIVLYDRLMKQRRNGAFW